MTDILRLVVILLNVELLQEKIMSQSIHKIKSRIRSIESTRKLTKAMEMVSVAKLKRSEKMLGGFRDYFVKLESLLKDVLAAGNDLKHPFLEATADKGKIVLCVITSDTGLCGIYNHSVIRLAEEFLSKHPVQEVQLVTFGKKGFAYFKKRGFDIPYSFVGINSRYSEEIAQRLFDTLSSMFLQGRAKEVHIVYTSNQLNYHAKAVIEKFLKLDYEQGTKEFIFDPDKQAVISGLIPVYLLSKIKMILLEAFTAEHRLRAVAMGQASINAIELLEKLILMRNKVRQANITKELLEVISSQEALKG